MPINPLGGGNLFSMFGSYNDTSRQVVTVFLSDKHAGVEREADALLSSLGFKTADLKAYQQTYGVDLRDKMIDGLRNQPINYTIGQRVYDSASKSYKFQTTIGMDKALYGELKSFIAERHSAQPQDIAGANGKIGAFQAAGAMRKQQVLAQLPPVQVNVVASAAAILLELPAAPTLPIATEITTAAAKTGAAIAEAAVPAVMIASEAATPLLVGSHLAQKYVESRQSFEMQQAEKAYEALEAQDVAKLPPFGSNEPLAPPPPLINPNQSEQGRKLTQPLTTPAAPPNVATGTPPFSKEQIPPSPPLTTPRQDDRLHKLATTPMMSKAVPLTLTPTGDIDPAADALAKRIGGAASVMIKGFGNREFDAVSDRYIAQSSNSVNAAWNPSNFLNQSKKAQIRETLRAASETGRKALFEFTNGEPAKEVVDFIKRNAARARAEFEITVK